MYYPKKECQKNNLGKFTCRLHIKSRDVDNKNSSLTVGVISLALSLDSVLSRTGYLV
jgi:hypothetical protein